MAGRRRRVAEPHAALRATAAAPAAITGGAPATARRDGLRRALTDPAGVLGLQRLSGNRAVRSELSVPSVAPVLPGLTVQRRKRRKRREPTTNEVIAGQVAADVKAGRIATPEQQLPPGMYGPPAPGGAFWRLNGLNPTDLVAVLGLCSKETRAQLLSNIAAATGRFNRPRLESALRSVAWNEKTAGIAGLELMDAVRSVWTGSFAPVFATLTPLTRVDLIARLRTLDRPTLITLQGHLFQAPPARIPILTQVISDLLGTGTTMAATDVIDLKGLSGVRRRMAQIYNLRGQLIFEQAAALDISTHAAAGIMRAESGGATFSPDTDQTIIRFENHVFWRRWGSINAANTAAFRRHFRFASPPGDAWEGHRFREDPAGAWESFHGDQAAEWRAINLAASLSGQEPAYNSASWGAGQIMGFNAGNVGYASSVEMAAAFNVSERAQVSGIFDFIEANHLQDEIRADNYLALARAYNGTGQAPHYAGVIRDYAEAYQAVTDGKTHVRP